MSMLRAMRFSVAAALAGFLLGAAGCGGGSDSGGDGGSASGGGASGESGDPIQIIGFDEADETLQGIVDGEVYGTVVQNPYKYGYESVRILAGLERGKSLEELGVPESGFVNIPARKIKRDNVEQFRAELAERMSAAESDSDFEPEGEDPPHVGYVTNGVASFWVIGEAGARAAGREFDAQVDVRMPPNGTVAEQQRQLEELVTKGVDGVAISPIDAKNQTGFLNDLAEQTRMMTQDSDAPETDRLCYVGMDNYKAGRMAGELVKEALPEGGEVIIFVGRLSQDNSKARRQGVIDELLGRSMDSSRYDPPDAQLEGEKYTVLDTRTDGFDLAKAKANVEDAIARHPGVDAMVGLFAYNPPKILQAVKDAGRATDLNASRSSD